MPMTRRRARDSVVIASSLAQRSLFGGHTWAMLQYALGFASLGMEVTIVDRFESGMQSAGSGASPYRRLERSMSSLDAGLEYSVLGDRGVVTHGIARRELVERIRGARMLLNVMGFLVDQELLAAARRRVFLDIDPGFGQLWKHLDLADLFAGHDDFVTVGLNIGSEGCSVPTAGKRWLTTPHPVVLDLCPTVTGGVGFTSVGSWRGPYDPIDYAGRTLGLRVHEFRKFASLPRLVDSQFRVALEIDPADARDRALLEENGWELVDPVEVAPDPESYLRFVQGSRAEFTVAKGIYVDLNTGWLGDRTACYLASGKPALVQDTGLAGHYPLGEGLIAYSTLQEAVAGVRAIERDYNRHAHAARSLAEQHFDARLVLGQLLEELGSP
jgi:hypothetical protein